MLGKEKCIEQKRKLGHAVAIVGVAAGMTLSAAACSPMDREIDKGPDTKEVKELAGSVEFMPETEQETQSSETESSMPETEDNSQSTESVPPNVLDDTQIPGGIRMEPDDKFDWKKLFK